MRLVDTQQSLVSRKIFSLVLSAFAIAFCAPVQARQAKPARIGAIFNNPGSLVDAFRKELRELGHIEGHNVLMESRFITGDRDRIPNLVTDLVKLNVDILVATSPPTIRAAKQATKTTPIVMVTPQDPVANGIVESLARPGG